MMNSRQVDLVQQTFAQVEPIADTAATLFYGRLFQLDPQLRLLFPKDLSDQKKKLMNALKLVVEGLHTPEKILPAVRYLGERHQSYGVEDSHYELVGQALIWTLGQGLGDAFTAEVQDAWTAAYNLLARVMREPAPRSALV